MLILSIREKKNKQKQINPVQSLVESPVQKSTVLIFQLPRTDDRHEIPPRSKLYLKI